MHSTLHRRSLCSNLLTGLLLGLAFTAAMFSCGETLPLREGNTPDASSYERPGQEMTKDSARVESTTAERSETERVTADTGKPGDFDAGNEKRSPDAVPQDSQSQEAPTDRASSPEKGTQEAKPEGCSGGRCSGACVDFKNNDKHCGKCGNSCPKGRACFDGKCLIPSKLWGRRGELFSPTGRLMDWSYAGYGHGEKALPSLKPTINITSYGAKPNDNQDDTAAFEKAVAAASRQGGTILVPKGTWILSKRLRLSSRTVIQGEGIGQTILSIPKSLTEVYGNKGLSGGGTSSYSFGGAFLEARGSSPLQRKLATITNSATRGGNKIQVDNASQLKPKQWVLFVQTDSRRTLMNHLHANLMKGGDDNIGDRWTGLNRILSINGKTITLERNFPVNIEQRWKPAIYPLTSLRTQVGIEKMTIRFPKTKYPGHFKERGYNAIDFFRTYQCWVRQVRIENADYGVNFRFSYNNTADGVTIFAQRPGSSLHGHHALNIGHGGDNLFIRFNIDATFVHDVTVEWYSTGNVITQGKGRNLRMDHHRAAPYLTLWTELDLGQGSQPFKSGGRGDRGPNTAAYATFWNLAASRNMSLPSGNFGPRMTFVGFQTSATKSPSPYDWWLERISPQLLGPPNLWKAQRQKRLGKP